MFQVLGLERADSTEFDAETRNPVVIFMPEVQIYYLFSFLAYIWYTHMIYLLDLVHDHYHFIGF